MFGEWEYQNSRKQQMKKHTRSEVDRGQTVAGDTRTTVVLISIQHNAVIIAAQLDSAARETLNATMSNILKHTVCYMILLTVSLLGCGSDEQIAVEEEAEEDIQITERYQR